VSYPVIEIESLSKQYRIGAEGTQLRTFREAIGSAAAAPLLWARRNPVRSRRGDSIWALRNVSLDVRTGQVIGVIGRNGAGKSTLLKILSRITEPTRGRVLLRGRVACLLEVGTGFHSELTGRENVYLSAAILGMSRVEIRRKFDDIVGFAEIGGFLDTPVKRYSSGMEMRLAFSVAAHLDPEILIIDEVLAVGDAGFQAKCLGKMQDVSRSGRTVVIVSHNLGMIQSLCDRCILLTAGQVVMDDEPRRVISHYVSAELSEGTTPGEVAWLGGAEAPGGKALKLRRVRLIGVNGSTQSAFEVQNPLTVEIEYEAREALRGMRVNLQLLTSEGVIAFTTSDHDQRAPVQPVGCYRTACTVPARLLNHGRYVVRISADIPCVKLLLPWCEVISFVAAGAHNHGSSFPEKVWPGAVAPRCQWSLSTAPALPDQPLPAFQPETERSAASTGAARSGGV
jgi:lipopolysaccharide transport system ATP-binding protein